MIDGVRYLILTAARTRAPLVALAAVLFAVVGTFSGSYNEVGGSWALTTLFAGGLAAWLVVAVLASEPASQAEIATAAHGGLVGRARVTAALVVLVALGLAIVFVAYPLVLGLLVSDPVFKPPARTTDVLAAFIAHVTSACVGGALGVLCSPPRIVRAASGAAAVLAGLLLLIAVARPFGDLGGPMATADALNRAPDGEITAAELSAYASCVMLFALLLLASARVDRRRA